MVIRVAIGSFYEEGAFMRCVGAHHYHDHDTCGLSSGFVEFKVRLHKSNGKRSERIVATTL